MATKKDRQEAAALVRRILNAVERGEIDADTQVARRLRRRLEGAVVGLEAGNELTPAEGEDEIPRPETDEGDT